MKKFLILVLIISCGHVRTRQKCTITDKAQFDKTFEICMKGQRTRTGTDDADDFVKECRHTAKEISETCKTVYYATTGNDFSGWRHENCETAKIPEHIEMCKEAGHGK